MTFDRAYFSIKKENLISADIENKDTLDNKIKKFLDILDYEYNTETVIDNKPTTKEETYQIGAITNDMFPNKIENIALKSKNVMTEKQFDELINCFKDTRIRLIQARFYLTEEGHKTTIDWLNTSNKAYLEMASDMYRFSDMGTFLTGFMGNFETKKSSGLLIPDTGSKKIYITTIRTRIQDINTQDSIDILSELKKGTYFLKE